MPLINLNALFNVLLNALVLALSQTPCFLRPPPAHQPTRPIGPIQFFTCHRCMDKPQVRDVMAMMAARVQARAAVAHTGVSPRGSAIPHADQVGQHEGAPGLHGVLKMMRQQMHAGGRRGVRGKRTKTRADANGASAARKNEMQSLEEFDMDRPR